MKTFLLGFLLVFTLSSCEMPFASLFQSTEEEKTNTGFVLPETKEEKEALIDTWANEHGNQTPEEKQLAEQSEKSAWEEYVAKKQKNMEAGETVIKITSPERSEKLLTGNTRVVLWGEIGNPEKVASIEVNGFRLKRYKSGETKFSYIAEIAMGTMKRGDNTYVIEAKDASGTVVATEQFVIISDQRFAALAHTGAETWIFALLIAGVFGFRFRKSFI